MTIRKILSHPDPILREICVDVDEKDPMRAGLATDLLDTMYHSEGRGLAAPQIGHAVRAFVFDANWKKTGNRAPIICINPHVMALGNGTLVNTETCLSILDQPTEVERASRVMMQWLDLDGNSHLRTFANEAAVIIQHEFDHLDGRLCIDYGSTP